MISKSFGLLFFLKKQHGDTKVHRPIYLRITIDGVIKEMSVQRNWDPVRWDPATGRATAGKASVRPGSAKQLDHSPTPEADAKALNAYLDTLQAKVQEARHQLLMSGKPVTAEAVRNIVQGRESSGERPHLLLEIFQYHNDQVKALLGKEYSKGTLTKFTTVLNHTRTFLRWKYKSDDIDIRKLDYEFSTELEFWYKSVQHCDNSTTMKYIACVKKMVIRALRSGWLQHDPSMGNPGSGHLPFQLLYRTGLFRRPKAPALRNQHRHRRRKMDLHPTPKDRYSLPDSDFTNGRNHFT